VPAVFVVSHQGRCGVITADAPVPVLTDAVDALTATGVHVTWLPVLAGATSEPEVFRG